MDFDTNVKGSYNVSIEKSSTYDSETSSSSASGNINGNANASVALDLYKIKEGSLEGSSGRAYGSLAYTSKVNDSISEEVESGEYEGNFSIDNEKVNVYVSDKEYETNQTLKELASQLKGKFVYTHRACIVNLNNIKTIDKESKIITFINNDKIDLLSRNYLKELKDILN